MDEFIGRIKDMIRVATGKEPSYLMRNMKYEEAIVIGDTRIYLSDSHLSNHIKVRIFTSKENKIDFLDKSGNSKREKDIRGQKEHTVIIDDKWNN